MVGFVIATAGYPFCLTLTGSLYSKLLGASGAAQVEATSALWPIWGFKVHGQTPQEPHSFWSRSKYIFVLALFYFLLLFRVSG